MERYEIKKLNKALGHGGDQKVYDKIREQGYTDSYSAVWAVLNGRYYKEYIIDAAIEVLAKMQEDSKNRSTKIKQAIS